MSTGGATSPDQLLPRLPAVTLVPILLLAAVAMGGLASVDPILGVGAAVGVIFLTLLLLAFPVAIGGWVVVAFLTGLPGLTGAPALTTMLIGGVWLATMAGRREQVAAIKTAAPWVLIAPAVYFGWLLLSSIWATDFATSKSNLWLFFTALVTVPIVATAVDRARTVGLFVGAYVFGAALIVLLAVVLGPGSYVDAENSEGRLQVANFSANLLGATSATALVLVPALWATYRDTAIRAAVVVAGALLAYGLVGSGSRSGFIALAVAALVALAVCRGRRRQILLGIAGGVVVLAGFVAANPEVIDRVTSGDATGTGRTELWAAALHMFEDHPVLGVGTGNFIVDSKNYALDIGPIKYLDAFTDKPLPVHNFILEALAETGVIGLVLLFFAIGACVAATHRAAAAFRALGDARLEFFAQLVLVAQSSIVAAGLFLPITYSRQMWMLLAVGPAMLGVAIAARRRADVEERSVVGERERRARAERLAGPGPRGVGAQRRRVLPVGGAAPAMAVGSAAGIRTRPLRVDPAWPTGGFDLSALRGAPVPAGPHSGGPAAGEDPRIDGESAPGFPPLTIPAPSDPVDVERAPADAAIADEPPEPTMRRGVGWSLFALVASKFVSFIALLVLARLLVPSEFGVVAAVTTYLAFLEIASDLGVKAVVVYEQEKGHSRRIQTAFTLNLMIVAGATVIGLALAIPASSFFGAGDHRELFLLAVLSLTFGGLSNVHDGLLLREMSLGKRVLPQLARGVVQGIVAITLALAGLGAEAMVIGVVAGSLAWTVLHWTTTKFRPTFTFDKAIAKSMIAYASGAWLFFVTSWVSIQADVLVVGNQLNNQDLGVYTMAYRLPELLVFNIAWMLSTVAFPALSRERTKEDADVVGSTIGIIHYLALYALPMAAGLAVLAPVIVTVLFSATWASAGPVLSGVALAVAMITIFTPITDAAKAVGRQWSIVILYGIHIPMVVAAVIYADRWGPEGVAWASVIATVVFLSMLLTWTHRSLGISIGRLASGLRGPLAAALGVVVCAGAVRVLLLDAVPDIAVLVLGGVAGVAGALGGLRLLSPGTLTDVADQLGVAKIIARLRPTRASRA